MNIYEVKIKICLELKKKDNSAYLDLYRLEEGFLVNAAVRVNSGESLWVSGEKTVNGIFIWETGNGTVRKKRYCL